MSLFAEVFDEPEHYNEARPESAYVEALLDREDIFVLVAEAGDTMVGGLVAYEWPKLERRMREAYLYELAVVQSWRRQGVASALLERLLKLVRPRGVTSVWVQAELEDEAARALYARFAKGRKIAHFEIDPYHST